MVEKQTFWLLLNIKLCIINYEIKYVWHHYATPTGLILNHFNIFYKYKSTTWIKF